MLLIKVLLIKKHAILFVSCYKNKETSVYLVFLWDNIVKKSFAQSRGFRKKIGGMVTQEHMSREVRFYTLPKEMLYSHRIQNCQM